MGRFFLQRLNKTLTKRGQYKSFLFGATVRSEPGPLHSRGSQQRTTVSRTPLKEWLALRRDLYLTTHNTWSRQTCPCLIRIHLNRRGAADLRLRPCGQWHRQKNTKALSYFQSDSNLEPSKFTCFHCHNGWISFCCRKLHNRTFQNLFPFMKYYYDKVRENEMRKVYSTNARNGKCERSLIRSPRSAEFNWKTYESIGREDKY